MRPNVDLSHATHGRVKDFAEEQDITLTEAYERLLNTGLDVVETSEGE